ncbi:unnamed protein product [Linum trigynum]|uniref:Uncharacterized protein n=1 Tax=Linum trigynum TaxID=586398 RepID=A0AAV2G7B7_9ROSI
MYPQLLILLLNLEVPTDSSKLPRKLKQQLRRFPLDGWSQEDQLWVDQKSQKRNWGWSHVRASGNCFCAI